MENGIGNLVDQLSGLTVNDSSKDDSLFQVMKAVEASETTIKQQVEKNYRLRIEHQRRTEELERYKSETSIAPRPHSDGLSNHMQGPCKPHQSVPALGNQEDRFGWMDNTTSLDPHGTLVLQNIVPRIENPALQTHAGSQQYSEGNKVNRNLKVLPGRQVVLDNSGFSQFSSPSLRPFSPSSHQRDGDFATEFNLSGQGLMQMSEVNSSSLWKQDLALKVQKHEEEILQLRKHVAEYSIKEAQIQTEKYVLEKRITYLQMAFDQQQQDLVDAASKALSYRQEIIEESIPLAYALQDAQQERLTFVSSLLPLLAEYFLQPPVLDAQPIVNNLKVLFTHLQEKLIVTESKLKESQYQLTPWNSDALNRFIPQTPDHSIEKKGLDLMAQATYSHGQTPISSPNDQTTRGWDLLGHQTHHVGFGGVATKDLEPDNLGRSLPSSSW